MLPPKRTPQRYLPTARTCSSLAGAGADSAAAAEIRPGSGLLRDGSARDQATDVDVGLVVVGADGATGTYVV